jgi:hypothetical protein
VIRRSDFSLPSMVLQPPLPLIVHPGIGSSGIKLALWALCCIPSGDTDSERAAFVCVIKAAVVAVHGS